MGGAVPRQIDVLAYIRKQAEKTSELHSPNTSASIPALAFLNDACNLKSNEPFLPMLVMVSVL